MVLTAKQCWTCLRLKVGAASAVLNKRVLKGGTSIMTTGVALLVRLVDSASGASCVETAIG